jgi:hypothetical protein
MLNKNASKEIVVKLLSDVKKKIENLSQFERRRKVDASGYHAVSLKNGDDFCTTFERNLHDT